MRLLWLCIALALGTMVIDGRAADSRTLWFTNAAAVSIPSSGAATPYPSTIELSGLPGVISQVKASLDRLEHSYPDDLDILLVNSRTNVLLLSDRGGTTAITNVSLLFDDAATGLAPDSSKLNSGTFKPSNDGSFDYLPSPAPFPPHGTLLSSFAGASPNDTWSLYVLDDTGGDAGILAGGWRLCITTTNILSPGNTNEADLSLTVTETRDPALTEQTLSWVFTVINSGPEAATGVVVSNTLPTEVQFVSATSSQGSCTVAGGLVTCNAGNLAAGALATIRVQVIPLIPSTINVNAGVTAAQPDQFPGNNSAAVQTTVLEGPPAISVADEVVTERDASTTNANFTLRLSHPADKEVRVDYLTVNGTASDSSDYYAASGTLTFPPGSTNLSVAVTVLGDTTAESDEDFFLNLSSAVNALLADTQARARIVNNDGAAGLVSRFQLSAVGSPRYQFVPGPLSASALDAQGNVVTNFNGTVSLSGLTGTGTNTPRLLLTEVDLSNDGIELENCSSLPQDLTGWRIFFYDWIGWPYATEVFEFPSGAMAPPAGVLTIRDTGAAPGSYPDFFTAQGISWFNEVTNNPVAVLLVDPAGQPADFFCAVYAQPVEILEPLPIPAAQWSGEPVAPNTASTITYQRTRVADNNNASDWQLLTSTMGAANAGLAGPFAGPRVVATMPGVTGNFSSGTWAGSFTVNESVTNMYVLARDQDGHSGASGWFAVQPSVDLALTQTATPVTLVVGQDLTFALRVTNSGPGSAQGVTLTNALPGNVSFKSASSTQGSVSRSGSTVTAAIGTIAAGAQATVSIVATASAPGGATNQATAGTQSVDYRVTNNTALAGAWINYPPTISAIPAQAMPEDSVLANIPFSISDAETPAGSLTVWASSSNPALIPPGNIVLAGSNTNRTLTLSPLTNQFGASTITVFVADSQNTSSNQFALTVTGVNDAPVLQPIASRSADEGTTVTVDPVFSNVESPPEILTFSLLSSPAGATVNASSGRITWTPSESQGPGTHSFTLRVSDNGVPSLSATQSFSVTVAEINAAPVLSPIANQTVNVPASFAYQAVAADADIPTNLLTFALVSGPAGFTMSTSGVMSWIPAPDFIPATNTVTYRVFDNGVPSLSTTGSFQLVVNHCPSPASPVLVRMPPVAGKLAAESLLGTDIDSDSLVLESVAALSSQGIPVTRDASWIYYTPPSTFSALDSISYVVRDGRGATNAGAVTIQSTTDTNTSPALSVKDLGGGSFLVRFSAIPSLGYRVEAADGTQPAIWGQIGSANADVSGMVTIVDTPPGGTPRAYRLAPVSP